MLFAQSLVVKIPGSEDDFRRVSLIAARSRDGLLSEPTAGAQPSPREPSFVPLSGQMAYSAPANAAAPQTNLDPFTAGLAPKL